jgi:hypothetical protein
MVGHVATVVTGERQGDDGGKRNADFIERMSGDKRQEPGNDNAPFDEKAWRREYMKLYMRKKRERLKRIKQQEQS